MRQPNAGVALAADGLRPVGSELRIDFGRAEAGVITAVSKLLDVGYDRRDIVPGCGDIVVWEDWLRLVFVDGDFRGWAAAPARFISLGGPFPTGPDGWLRAGVDCQ